MKDVLVNKCWFCGQPMIATKSASWATRKFVVVKCRSKSCKATYTSQSKELIDLFADS